MQNSAIIETGLSDFQKKDGISFDENILQETKVRIIQYKLQKCSGGVIKIINNIQFNTIGIFISSKKVYT